MLCADGQADSIRLNALIQQLFPGELGMGGTGRVNYEALYVGYIGKQGEDFQIVNKPPGFFLPPLISKVKILAPPSGKYFSYNAWSG